MTTQIPKTMKAAAIDRFGPPKVLTVRSFPVPVPGPGEVLIALYAAGVGIWDVSVRKGTWKPDGRSRFPLIPGTDGAGIVVAKGPGVRRFGLGDRVWAYHYANPKGGFYAEYAAVDARHVGHAPRHLDWSAAGAGAATGLTALQGIDDVLRARRGETVLVFGATGAVGTLAVQFAKRRRTDVLGTATGRAAANLLRKLGADGVFDARSHDFVKRLQALAPEGISAALVLTGGAGLEQCLDFVRPGGRIAYPNGVECEPRKRPGVSLIAYDAEPGPRKFARLEQAAGEAALAVPLSGAYPLAEAARAHQRLERGHVLGRIVLRIRRGRR